MTSVPSQTSDVDVIREKIQQTSLSSTKRQQSRVKNDTDNNNIGVSDHSQESLPKQSTFKRTGSENITRSGNLKKVPQTQSILKTNDTSAVVQSLQQGHIRNPYRRLRDPAELNISVPKGQVTFQEVTQQKPIVRHSLSRRAMSAPPVRRDSTLNTISVYYQNYRRPETTTKLSLSYSYTNVYSSDSRFLHDDIKRLACKRERVIQSSIDATERRLQEQRRRREDHLHQKRVIIEELKLTEEDFVNRYKLLLMKHGGQDLSHKSGAKTKRNTSLLNAGELRAVRNVRIAKRGHLKDPKKMIDANPLLSVDADVRH